MHVVGGAVEGIDDPGVGRMSVLLPYLLGYDAVGGVSFSQGADDGALGKDIHPGEIFFLARRLQAIADGVSEMPFEDLSGMACCRYRSLQMG